MCKKVISVLLVLCVSMASVFVSADGVYAKKKEKSKSKYEGCGVLRVFSTSDLHGQSVRYSYDTGCERNGSLAQIINVVKKSRKSLKHGASLLVDSGDTVYGLAATAQNQGLVTGKQYMYSIMKKVGYDAITLGNHDFDYGYKYIKKCLAETKLDKKVVLSNVVNAKTEKSPWKTCRIIKKTLKTTKGKKKTVKIGITGAVTPSLSNMYDTSSDLKSYDIVESVREQAKYLKRRGADIVIVLSHSDLGNRTVEEKEDNVSYRVSRIKEVDMVCAGHGHTMYPDSTNKSLKVYSYPYVNKDGLIGGKAVVEEDDRGDSLGITDIKFKFVKGKKAKIVSQKVNMRRITKNDPEDEQVLSLNKKFDNQYQDIMNKKITSIDSEINGYFGMIEDNALIQVVNEAKIQFAQKLIKELRPHYKDYPTIAATFYTVTGNSGRDDYVSLSGDVLYKHVLNYQSYDKEQERVYYITGEQLKEELEFAAASAFQTVGTADQTLWSDPYTQLCVLQGLTPILSEEWQDWTSFAVFDGIEYTIDPTVEPRYNRAGKKINDTYRIKSLTLNGRTISNGDIFTLAVDKLSKDNWAPVYSQMTKQYIINRKLQSKHMADIIADYMVAQSPDGTLRVKADNNWSVDYPKDGNYFVKSSAKAIEACGDDEEFERINFDDEYGYYRIDFSKKGKTEAGPLVILSPLKTDKSGDPVEVKVIASDSQRVEKIQYLKGYYDSTSKEWSSAKTVSNNRIDVDDNDIYSVRASDRNGNSTIRYFSISNIDTTVATTPFVNAIKNTDIQITGVASPEADIFIDTINGFFTCKAGKNGEFTCPVANLYAGKSVKVWQEDALGRVSEKLSVTVARKGANQPIIDKVTNKKAAITGTLNDSKYCRVVTIRGGNVYIPKGQRKNYKQTKIYKKNKSKEIYEVKYKYNKSQGRFSLAVPNLYADQNLTVYSYDWVHRASAEEKISVEDVAPNQPKVMKVVSQEGKVYGTLPKAKEGVTYTVTVDLDGEIYEDTVSADGNFSVKVDNLVPDSEVKVTVKDTTAEGVVRTSRVRKADVVNFYQLGEEEFINGYIDEVYNKDNVITGYLNRNPSGDLYLMYGNSRHRIMTDKDGMFEYELPRSRSHKEKIGIISRNEDGTLQTYRYVTVRLSKPDEPYFVTEKITESTKKIIIACVDKAKAYLRIGSKKYKEKKIKAKNKKYYYIFVVDRPQKGEEVSAWLTNSAGNGKKNKYGKVE